MVRGMAIVLELQLMTVFFQSISTFDVFVLFLKKYSLKNLLAKGEKRFDIVVSRILQFSVHDLSYSYCCNTLKS